MSHYKCVTLLVTSVLKSGVNICLYLGTLGPGKVFEFGGRVFDSEKSLSYNPRKGVADFRKKKMNNLNSQQILDPKLVNVVKILLHSKTAKK